jgi:hypothetical protein
MTELKDNIDNRKLLDVCRWDLGDIGVVLVIDFEVFCGEECLKGKLPCEELDAKTM